MLLVDGKIGMLALCFRFVVLVLLLTGKGRNPDQELGTKNKYKIQTHGSHDYNLYMLQTLYATFDSLYLQVFS